MTESAIVSGYADADQDFQWAVAMASFAEILKQSFYADPAGIDSIEQIIIAQAGRDADRTEFSALFQTAKLLLP